MKINKNGEYLQNEEIHIIENLADIGYDSIAYEYKDTHVYELLGCFNSWGDVRKYLPEEFI